MIKRLSVFLAVLVAGTVSCLTDSHAQTQPSESALKERLAALSRPGGSNVQGARIAAVDFLPKLYAALGYKLAWSRASDVEALKSAVARSWEDGLLPSDFHAAKLSSITGNASGSATAEADILLSDALARLLYQLFFGKVSPNAIDPNWNFTRPMLSADPVTLVAEALAAGRVSELIESARLKHPLYSGLKATLQSYTQLEINGGWQPIPEGPAIKPGDRDPRVPLLRARLQATGEYTGQAQETGVLDEPLVAALKTFQSNNGLEPDGVAGPGALAALNISAHDRVEQIRVNLERARWILRGIGDEMVVVNIAGHYLHLVLRGKRVWTTRVIVGKAYNKTPVFTELMKLVVINPDWTVPRSIVRNETFPKASANPAYLSANDYYLTSASGPVEPSTVNWSSYSSSTFPYGVVQRPGPRNALGQVKFLFPNKYSVYLHDTPSRQLFAKSERSLSHGCIRVENPLKLAEFILGDLLGWTRTKIDAAVASGKTQNISLPKPLPVLLLYWTVDPSFEGGGRFYPDIYGRDERLLKALNMEFLPVTKTITVKPAKAAPAASEGKASNEPTPSPYTFAN